MKRIKITLFVVGVLLIVFNIASTIYFNQGKYLSRDYWQTFPQLEKVYLGSQYINKNPVGWIPDDTIFAYAAGALIRGDNPILIIPDAPPLGKYLIGLSTLMFNNPNIVVAFFGVLSLIMLYVVTRQVLKDNFLALLPPLFYSFEPMFKNQFIFTPALDLFQVVFLLSYFFFINKAFFGKKRVAFFYIIASIFLGLFVSTKFFVSGFTIVAASFAWAILSRRKDAFINLSLTLPIAVFVLLTTYARVFAFGYNVKEFLGIQKWIFLYHKSQIIYPFSAWDLLLFNRWHVWFGDKPIISDSQWFITWPIITVLSVVTMVLYIFKKIERKKETAILMLWVIFYLGLLSFGQVFSRYFIILLPALYIIALYGLVAIAQQYIFLQKSSLLKKKKGKK